MAISPQRLMELEELCRKFRIDIIEILHQRQSGHPGGSLSAVEIMTALYFEIANASPENFSSPDRDRIVLTKGHVAPILYRVLAEKGYFPVEEMTTLRTINSRLQGHPCTHDGMGIELSTGPLGIGFAAAVGMALANRLMGNDAWVYTVSGDGELNEGVVWEAVMSAAKYKLDHLVMIIDNNGVQLDGTNDEIMPMPDLARRFEAFGCHVIECDGHDISAICESIDIAKNNIGKPTVLIAKTIKGKGVSFMEGKNTWHGAPIDDASYNTAMIELRGE